MLHLLNHVFKDLPPILHHDTWAETLSQENLQIKPLNTRMTTKNSEIGLEFAGGKKKQWGKEFEEKEGTVAPTGNGIKGANSSALSEQKNDYQSSRRRSVEWEQTKKLELRTSFVKMTKTIPGSQIFKSTDEVCLIRSSSFPMSQFGVTTWSRNYTIRIKNLAYDKIILLRGIDSGGKYMEIKAHYVSTSGEHEIWQAHGENLEGFSKFTVNYLVNGVEYEDDNGGKQYSDSKVIGVQLHNNVFVQRWKANELTGYHPTSLRVEAHVQDLSPNKSVEVWYTTDEWQTTCKKKLEFQESESYGAGYTTSPNKAGVEFWSGSFNVGNNVSRVLYCIRYECDQGEFWDNNFGQNYEANRLSRSPN